MFEWLIPALIFFSALLFLLWLNASLQQRRFKRHALAVSRGQELLDSGVRTARSIRNRWFKLINLLGSFQDSWLSKPWRQKMERKIAFLPQWHQGGPASWWALKELSTVIGGIAGSVIWTTWLGTLTGAVVGFYLPDLWLAEKQRHRLSRIMTDLPNMLDLLAACLEAGLGFDQALNVVLDRGHQGYLAEELRELRRAVTMGRARGDALKDLASRIDDIEFRTFSSALIQAEKMGIGITHALKDQAVQLRSKYSQKIEKRALEAPVKILFPLIVFIFPIIFIILFGPILLRFIEGL